MERLETRSMRVQQDNQRQNVSSTSGGSGALKSSGVSNSLAADPKRRPSDLGAVGTRRATGFPARKMTISSTNSTRTSNRERLVLASWILTLTSIISM